MDLVGIRFEVLGGKESAAEAQLVSKSVAGTGTAAATAGKRSSIAAKGVGALRSSLAALGRAAKLAAFGLGAGLAVEAVRSVNAFRESRKVGKQTEAVIKSTGGAANVTAKDVANLAGALSLKTGVDDEVIQSGANMLLTFKNIRNEVGKGNDIFNQATATANDMAAALGTEPRKSAIMLGKALNDPITGITALTRVGVTFDEQTKERITSLVEQGDTMKAQQIILKELNSEFGGSARAGNDAFDRLGVTIENLEEKLGKLLMPTLQDAAKWLNDIGSILNDDNLTGDQKWDRISKEISTQLSKALNKAADIAPKIARAVLNGFLNANAWVKLAGGLWLAKILGGRKLIAIGGKTAGPIAKSFGTSFVAGTLPFLVGSAGAESLTGLFGANGKIATKLKGPAKAAGGFVGRAFGLGLVTLGAFIIWEKREEILDAARSIADEVTSIMDIGGGGTTTLSPEEIAAIEANTGNDIDNSGNVGGRNPRLAPPVVPKPVNPNTGNGKGHNKRPAVFQAVLPNGKILAEMVLSESEVAAALA